jgi:hypothetical protein
MTLKGDCFVAMGFNQKENINWAPRNDGKKRLLRRYWF